MSLAEALVDHDPSRQTPLAEQLAADLSGGRLELPSFPDVVIRIREALADENVSLDRVARLVGTEPALAARLLRLANSAAINHAGRPVTDLRAAITRMGANLVRTTALAFALHQIQRAEAFRPIAGELRRLWESATRVAAVSHALARRLPGRNAEEALLAGLLHSVGTLYILTRCVGPRPSQDREEDLAAITARWHAAVGRSILANWGLPATLCEAIGRQGEFDHAEDPDASDLAHLLATARLLGDHLEVRDLVDPDQALAHDARRRDRARRAGRPRRRRAARLARAT